MAAARILVHALELCGKDASRESLVTALEGLYEYETGLMPKITFGPNRRIGALGAYIVTIDTEKNCFRLLWNGWQLNETPRVSIFSQKVAQVYPGCFRFALQLTTFISAWGSTARCGRNGLRKS